MFGRQEKLKTEAMQNAIATTARGVYKRIDENRELLELLQKEVPELLERCFWIEGWLGGNDHFFREMARLAETPNKVGQSTSTPFPRPWPGKRSLGDKLK